MTPPRAPHHVISRLRTAGGFLAGLDMELADGLNCFIGGRGAGKTTALEFLRFGLGIMPDQKTSPVRHRAIETLVKANLGAGRIKIDLETKDGLRYCAERSEGESVAVVNEQGVGVPVSLDRDQIFGVDVFSQNEIEEMAISAAAQLTLLDRFRENETTAISREIDGLLRDIKLANDRLRRLDGEVADLLGKSSEIGALQERLRGMAAPPGPDAARLNAAHESNAIRSREERMPGAALSALESLERGVEQVTTDFHSSVGGLLPDLAASPTNDATLARIRKGLSSVLKRLETSAADVVSEIRKQESAIRDAATELAAAHSQQDAEYRAVVAQTAEESGRMAERAKLQAALAAAEEAERERATKVRLREEILTTRRSGLERASELRDNRFVVRKNVAQRLTAEFPFLRVTVEQSAGQERYREEVTTYLRGVGLKQGPTAEKLVEKFLPDELAEAVAGRDIETIMRETGFERDRSARIIEALINEGLHYDLQCIELEDVPCIELKDGDQYKQSGRLSTGQRCTTILPILLLQNERPLLIDQPEDNLDNAFVYDSVVTALRAVRGSRQVIFVTHNPNIPVLGEAERVFVFESDGKKAAVVQAGTVDECKAQIEQILEGGKEAFMKRHARYGH